MTIRIRVNERDVEWRSGSTLDDLRRELEPEADVLVHNGFPAEGHELVADGDDIVFIRRGEVPGADELEAMLVSRHTPGVHGAIKSACVGVAGLGGLGSQVAMVMARMGIGRLVLADHDVVEPSNLNRQQYFIDQIGRPKVEALSESIRRINPYVKVEGHEVELRPDNIAEVFAGCRVLVEAFDLADRKEMLINAALAHLPETIVIGASGVAGYGPSQTIGVHRLSPSLFVVGDLRTEAGPGVGLMAPRVGVAAHVQANLVLRLLVDAEE